MQDQDQDQGATNEQDSSGKEEEAPGVATAKDEEKRGTNDKNKANNENAAPSPSSEAA